MRILTSLRKFLPVLRKEFGLRFLTSPCPAGLARRRPRSGADGWRQVSFVPASLRVPLGPWRLLALLDF